MLFSTVQNLKIDEENSDQRLDNFLYKLFDKQIARALIYSLIRKGQVRVNSARIKPNYYLKINDNIRIPPIKIINPNNQDINVTKKPNKKFLDFWQEKISKSIIFENENLLIINKPAKLAVHGGSKVTIGIIEILRNLRPSEHFLELVHRIDQDTSGCLMIAKKRSYLKKLHSLLREQKITKIYSALVNGIFPKKKIVEIPLKKIIKNSKEHVVKPDTSGSYAKTEFILEKIFIKQGYSLVIAKPVTGKTHQIRVHLSHIGFPIINDDKYGYRKNIGLNRMFLHARALKFVCPQTNEIIEVLADYDIELNKYLKMLN